MSAGAPDPDVVEETVAVDGRQLVIERPRDSEALLDEAAFEHDEFLPYWADLWPSALALARAVGGRSLHGARVLELGCGLGLPSIAAALAGGRVIASDWSPDALAFAARNARRNGAEMDTLVASWFEPAALLERAPVDLVLGSDLLYERRNVAPLLDLLPALAGSGGEVWIADPGRAIAETFLEQAAERFTIRSFPDPAGPRVQVHRLRGRAPG